MHVNNLWKLCVHYTDFFIVNGVCISLYCNIHRLWGSRKKSSKDLFKKKIKGFTTKYTKMRSVCVKYIILKFSSSKPKLILCSFKNLSPSVIAFNCLKIYIYHAIVSVFCMWVYSTLWLIVFWRGLPVCHVHAPANPFFLIQICLNQRLRRPK